MNYVIKIGGSLIPKHVFKIYQFVKKYTQKSYDKIYLFPGGGKFADLIRTYRKNLLLSDTTTHKMALACLDQNAYLIADICQCSFIYTLQETKKNIKFPAVIAPYRFLLESRSFSQYNLDIDMLTSTSSAVYVACFLNAQLIIATDVDGIYEKDPKKTKRKASLITKISTEKLKKIKDGGPLDKTVASLIDKYKMKTWVVNGKYPERIYNILTCRNLDCLKGTLIYKGK